MDAFRIALANVRFPAAPEESVTLAQQAIAQASLERAGLVCFRNVSFPAIGQRENQSRRPTLCFSNAPGPPLPRRQRKHVSRLCLAPNALRMAPS